MEKIRNFILIGLVVILSLITVYPFCVEEVNVNGESMYPTIENKSTIKIDKVFFKITKIKRFDIVCFENDNSKNLVKRVIGLPNENLIYNNDGLYINNVKIEDNYGDLSSTLNPNYFIKYKDFITGITLGEDEYFVLGDNRTVSLDSRDFGLIKYDQIFGRVI